MTKELLQQALDALEYAQGNINPERGFADEAEADIAAAITALRTALAQPAPAPVAWRRYEDGVTSFAVDPSAEPLFAAQPTPATVAQGYAEGFNDACKPAPAPDAKCDGGTCGLGGYCADCPKQQPAPARPDEFVCPYCFDQGSAPVVREPQPLTDEQIALAIFEARVGHSPFKRDGSTSFRIARAAIAKFCEVNGIGGGGNG